MIATVIWASCMVPQLRLSAWMMSWDPDSLNSFETHAAQIDTVTIEGIRCTANGDSIRDNTPSEENLAKTKKIAKQNRTKVFVIAVNSTGDGFDAKCLHDMLRSPSLMEKHTDALVQHTITMGVDGLDLDYESLNAADRDPFSTFVELLAKKLHSKRKMLAIAVHPKVSEPGTWDGTIAQDWPRLGKVVDRFRVMCYDQHWETSGAGPVASINWVSEVMSNAVKTVPKQKLEIGIPAYGYNWKGKKGESFGWKEFQQLSSQYQFKRDLESQELTGSYDGRVVFFADADASKPKIELAKKLGVRGLAMWRLGLEDPAIWHSFIRNK